MALNITYTVECHCGADAESTTTYLDLNPGDRIVIDAEMALGQTDFQCGKCGCTLGTGDLHIEVADHASGCDGEPHEDEDHESDEDDEVDS
jgi:hypothetical protein